MHELTIVTNIFKIVDEIADENSVTKINRISVKLGKLRQVSPQSLLDLFEIVSKDTKAENAILDLETIPMIMKCKICGFIFNVDNSEYLCRRCGEFGLDTVQGDELIIESLEGER